jgi:hypothetical protein
MNRPRRVLPLPAPPIPQAHLPEPLPQPPPPRPPSTQRSNYPRCLSEMREPMTSVLGLLAIPRTDPPPVRPKARDSLPWHTSRAVRPPSRRSFCRQSRRNAALKLAFHDMDNKRGSPRQRVLKSGKIVFAGGSFSVDCTIRNLSETGVRLRSRSLSPSQTDSPWWMRMLARVARQLSFGAERSDQRAVGPTKA